MYNRLEYQEYNILWPLYMVHTKNGGCNFSITLCCVWDERKRKKLVQYYYTYF